VVDEGSGELKPALFGDPASSRISPRLRGREELAELSLPGSQRW